MSGQQFDPRPYLRNGSLDVRARLLWLRSEHPDASIVTEHVVLDDQAAIFRAIADIPGGGHATGYGSVARADGADYIERAEVRAIGRALAALGYGLQYASDFDLLEPSENGDSAPAPAGAAPPPAAPRPEPAESVRSTEPATPQPTPAPAAPPRIRAVPPPEPESSAAPSRTAGVEPPEARLEQSAPRVEQPAAGVEQTATPVEQPTTREEPFEAANYSWNEFWRWARPLGYTRRSDLDALLGVDTNSLTPREVRRLLVEYREQNGITD